jgi:metal-responsive CopG/Arc/MetJ family transcriptional regulator
MEGGRKLSVPARLPPALVDALDAFAAENHVSRSEAVRQLIERGLDVLRRTLDPPPGETTGCR